MAAYLVLDKDPIALVQIAFTSVGSFPMALPAFVLAGALMEAAGISRRLVDIAEAFAGPITGGLGLATILACLFFKVISGSGPATTAVGMLMIPAMTQRRYDRAYASAVTAALRGLGIIIPPSIAMVIFGISALGMAPPPQALEKFGSFATPSIPKLFVAGVMPGLVMATSLILMNYFISRRGYKGLTEKWCKQSIGKALRAGIWSMLAPLIILGGIYAGFLRPPSRLSSRSSTRCSWAFCAQRAEAGFLAAIPAHHDMDYRAGAAHLVHRHGVWAPAGGGTHSGHGGGVHPFLHG